MFGNAFAGFIATEIRGRRFTCNSDLGTDIARSLNLQHSDIAAGLRRVICPGELIPHSSIVMMARSKDGRQPPLHSRTCLPLATDVPGLEPVA